MAVTGNGLPISDGATTTGTANATDFGELQAGAAASSETYTITNTGDVPLILGNLTFGGPDYAFFHLTSGGVSPIAPGDSSTFSVSFQGGSDRQFNATISIVENDPTQVNPFTFAISGEGYTPQLVVYSGSGSQAIVDGSTTTSEGNNTLIGTTSPGGLPITADYMMTNTGSTTLTLGSASLSGPNAGDFEILTQPTGPIGPGQYRVIDVQFLPTALGTRSATISFSDGDTSQPDPFTFAIAGDGQPGHQFRL